MNKHTNSVRTDTINWTSDGCFDFLERSGLRGDQFPAWEMGLHEPADLGLLKRRGKVVDSAKLECIEPFLDFRKTADRDDEYPLHLARRRGQNLLQNIAVRGTENQIVLAPIHRFQSNTFFNRRNQTGRYQRVSELTKQTFMQLEQQNAYRHRVSLIISLDSG